MPVRTNSTSCPIEQRKGVVRGVRDRVVVVVHLEALDRPVPRRKRVAPVARPAAFARVVDAAHGYRDDVADVRAAQGRVAVDLDLGRGVRDAYIRDVVRLPDVDGEIGKGTRGREKTEENAGQSGHC